MIFMVTSRNKLEVRSQPPSLAHPWWGETMARQGIQNRSCKGDVGERLLNQFFYLLDQHLGHFLFGDFSCRLPFFKKEAMSAPPRDSDVSLPRFPRTIHDTSHDGYLWGGFDVGQGFFHFRHHVEKVYLAPTSGRTGYKLGTAMS